MKANLRTLSVTEVMTRTGFSRDHVYRLVHSGQLAAVRTSPGAKAWFRIPERALEAYFEANAAVVQPARPPLARALDADAALPPIDHPAFD